MSLEPELVNCFRGLLDACLSCGDAAAQATCPHCGAPTASVPPEMPPPAAPLAHLVEGRQGWSRRRGVVVGTRADRLLLLQDDGGFAEIARKRCRIRGEPPGYGLVRSEAGAFVAATGLDLPPAVAEQLRHVAIDHAGGSLIAARALAADCAALGSADLIAALPLSGGERAWWRALSLARSGRWLDAATELLALPAGRYPQRLALWWRAAQSGALPETVQAAVVAAVEQLAPTSSPVTVAAAVLLRRLGRHTGIAADAELVAAASALGGEHVAPWLAGRRGEGFAARLLAARSDGSRLHRLGRDPSILDSAPPAVLDDLIDLGRIPPWPAHRIAPLACCGYLRARTSIAALDDATLAELGAHEERARRRLAAGERLPDDLPPPVADRFARLSAAIGGDGEALVAVAGAAGLDTGLLSAVLAEPARVPPASLLADPTLASWLLRHSTADPAAWPAEGLDGQQREFAAKLALRRAKELLYRWDWPAAVEAARVCLRFARTEDLRDEAHNLFAAAHWQLGNDDAASAALNAALDGEYTAALQVNFAVVAGELEPERAAAHLSRLVLEAPDLPLRVSAAYQAVRLWRSGDQWQHGDPLPAGLAGALRSLVVAPLEYDVFRDLLRLLAIHDHEWLAAPRAIDQSPHRSSVAARIWIANARAPEEFIRELASQFRSTPEDWLTELRDQLIQDLIDQLNTPVGDRPWPYGVLLLEHGLPMPVTARVLLLTLTLGGVLEMIDPTQSEPAPKFLEWLEGAALEVDLLPQAQAEPLRAVLEAPFGAVTAVYLEARRHQYRQAYELYQAIRRQVIPVPRHMLNVTEVRRVSRPGETMCRETSTLLDRLRGNAPDELVPAIDELEGRCLQLVHRFRQLYS